MPSDGNGNGGGPVAPMAETPEGVHPAVLAREGFFNLFVDAMRFDRDGVAVMPLDALTDSIKLGKPTSPAAKLTIRLHRGTAKRMRGSEEERDVVMLTVIPRTLINRMQAPLIYDPQGKPAAG